MHNFSFGFVVVYKQPFKADIFIQFPYVGLRTVLPWEVSQTWECSVSEHCRPYMSSMRIHVKDPYLLMWI